MGARKSSAAAAVPTAAAEWKYLEPRPDSWRRQLFVKGRKLPASVVWSGMLANHETREQTGENWELPVAAVDECIRYCESHRELLAAEADEVERFLSEEGVTIEPPAAH